ncbi:TonB-dependent receptor plug domain-containing protein [Fodinibius saliphilus]|uniref:TonB-dependent receptor plug domain-containing protein n=1 Tax=Fodinibius saliphilus TaxID=1920650 RepID=UPI001486E03B|nr:TonB-dependent receptor [Fodinibius saliphilus]
MVLLLIVSGTGQAQQAQTLDTLVVSKEMLVSSSRIPQTAAGSGRNITIIPAKTIRNLPVHTTDEVLRYASGIEVQSRGAFGTQSDFSIRGSSFSQVLVMVDGMRLNDPLTAHYSSNIPVAPSEIARIEVLHGPAAAQYGADAVGGVINIVTRSFSQKNSSQKTDAKLKVGYGQNDLKIGQGGFFYSNSNYRIAGGGMWFNTPGQELTPNYTNYFNIGKASLSAGFDLGNGWDLATRAAYDYRDYNAKYFYTASPYDEATDHTKAWWTQLKLTKQSDGALTTLKGAYKHNTDDFVFNPAFPANHHTTKLLNLQLFQYRKLSEQWSLTYGAQTTARNIRSNDRGNHSDWHYAGFSMAEWKPNSAFTLTGSLRLDHDENYGSELMPQLSASYDLDNWIVRASGGRSIRSASYTERYISTNLTGPLSAGRNLGNPDLKAERSWSGEVGFDFIGLSNIRFSATGFLRSSQNLIDYVETNSSNIPNNDNLAGNTNYLYAQNLSNVETVGVETELTIRKDLGANWLLSSRIGYTFANLVNDQNIDSKYIANYARHLINTTVSLRKGHAKVALTGLWKDRDADQATQINAFKASRYSVWNLKVDYNFYQNFTVGIEADNLFDKNYQDILGARMPERWIMGTLSWEL